jgi:hypothetical protein
MEHLSPDITRDNQPTRETQGRQPVEVNETIGVFAARRLIAILIVVVGVVTLAIGAVTAVFPIELIGASALLVGFVCLLVQGKPARPDMQ